MSRTAVIYAYYDKSIQSRNNVTFFFRNAYDESAEYFFVINVPNYDTSTDTTVYRKRYATLINLIPVKPNIHIYFRPNTGFDFSGYRFGVEKALNTGIDFDYFFFLNASTAGPFQERWLQKFQSLFVGDVKLVGSTVNICTWDVVTKNEVPCKPHVQTYAFMLDRECLLYVWSSGLFQKEFETLREVIVNQEVELSSVILSHGWNISCLVKEYQGIDYRTITKDINPNSRLGDIQFPGKCCFGRDVTPEEIIFTKSNRPLHARAVQLLQKTELFKPPSFLERFEKYGREVDCDKVTFHKYHHYYGHFLERFANSSGSMIEIGIDTGKSLAVWLKLFPKMYIYGVDIGVEDKGDRYEVFKLDQSKESDLLYLKSQIKHPVHLITDDGSHISHDQLLTFNTLFPLLEEGSVYVIEDCECSYWKRGYLYGNTFSFGQHHPDNIIEIFKDVADAVNLEYCHKTYQQGRVKHVEQIESVTFTRNAIVIIKGQPIRRVYRFDYNL